MKFFAAVFPGLALTITFSLLLLSISQAWLYRTKKFLRSKDLALFCFFGSLHALNVVFAHSRQFSDDFTWAYTVGFQPILFIVYYYYLRSMSYYVAIPRWLRVTYQSGNMILMWIAAAIYLYSLFSGVDLIFDRTNFVETGNFFIDSFTTRFGLPTKLASNLLGVSGLMNITMASVLFWRLRKSSQDYYMMTGLIITLFVSAFELLVLPFSIEYFIPLIFAGNLIEALRMCFLSTQENMARELPDEPVFTESGKTVDKVESAASSKESSAAYQNVRFDELRLSFLKTRLLKLMDDEKLYLDPNLSVEKLARSLKIPSYQLSQVLRFSLNTGFYDFINSYRIDEVQHKLMDPDYKDLNILEIAYESGFNSKSSFNKAFKMKTGLTPSQYRKSEALSQH